MPRSCFGRAVSALETRSGESTQSLEPSAALSSSPTQGLTAMSRSLSARAKILRTGSKLLRTLDAVSPEAVSRFAASCKSVSSISLSRMEPSIG